MMEKLVDRHMKDSAPKKFLYTETEMLTKLINVLRLHIII
jgi:DNA-binding HxlR family transcriptional regulator